MLFGLVSPLVVFVGLRSFLSSFLLVAAVASVAWDGLGAPNKAFLNARAANTGAGVSGASNCVVSSV